MVVELFPSMPLHAFPFNSDIKRRVSKKGLEIQKNFHPLTLPFFIAAFISKMFSCNMLFLRVSNR